MMRKILSVVCTLAILSVGSTAMAERKAKDCPRPAAAPERVEGEIVKIDASRNMVTLRGSDGQTHEFQGAPETVKDLKVGDRIEMKLRASC